MKKTVITIAMSAALGLCGTTGAVSAAPNYEQQVIALTNQHRAANGCGALAANAALTRAARGHSGDMAANDHMSHIGGNGSGPGDRIAQAGYPAATWAENIAYGQASATAVVTAWIQSPGHRANILNCQLAEIGVGRAASSRGVLYWTQDFGRRA